MSDDIPVFTQVGRITFNPLQTLGYVKPKLAKLPTRTHICADEPEFPRKRASPNPAGRASKVPLKLRERIRKEYAIGVRLRERAAKHTLSALSKKYHLSKPTLWHICAVKK